MRRNADPAIDPQSPASIVAGLWGSNSAFARAIGKTHSTTQKWLQNGAIPAEYHADIVAAARRDGKRLKPTHFVDARLFAAPVQEADAA